MRTKTIIGYKSVTDDLKSGHGGMTWEVGKWYKHEGEVKLCERGFHASRHPYDVLSYLQGDRLFKVEARGTINEQEDKFVASEMRLVKEVKDLKRLSVEFSVWCARRCLKNYESAYDDKRPRLAIEAAEAWLKARTPTQKDLMREKASVAWSAARSAAWSAESAARSAARSAAWSAESAARSEAWLAAVSAARSAESAARKKFSQLVKKHTEKTK